MITQWLYPIKPHFLSTPFFPRIISCWKLQNQGANWPSVVSGVQLKLRWLVAIWAMFPINLDHRHPTVMIIVEHTKLCTKKTHQNYDSNIFFKWETRPAVVVALDGDHIPKASKICLDNSRYVLLPKLRMESTPPFAIYFQVSFALSDPWIPAVPQSPAILRLRMALRRPKNGDRGSKDVSWPTSKTPIWLVVWNIFYFPIYWVSNHPKWLSYFSEGWLNHQPAHV